MKRLNTDGITLLCLAVSSLLLSTKSSLAQAITDPTQPTPPPSATKSPQTPSPFNLTAAYTSDILADISGGLSRGGAYVDLLKVSASYDGAEAGHEGLTGLVSIEHSFGSNFTENDVGGLQAISASEALPGSLRLYEAWVQQAAPDGQGGVKAGFIDINTTFDVQETAALFLNASNGIGPDIGDTGSNGPSDYPTPALAVTTFYRPSEGWTLQAGVFDGAAGDPAHRSDFIGIKFDGALIIGQIEKRYGDLARAEIGAWTYTSSFPSLRKATALGSAPKVSGNGGVYGLLEGRLMPAPGGGDGGLSGWVRAGLANGDINTIDCYLGGGLVYTGLIPGRDKDEMGFAVARAGIGSGAQHIGALAGRSIGRSEADLEATYRYVLRDWLNVQPDLQYVLDPHGDRRISNALVIGLRLAFTYSK